MGFLGDLWNKATATVSNLYESAKQTATDWLKGKYMAPGGYRYCGPGNSLEEGEPINASDASCRQHDIDYDRFAKLRGEGKVGKEELKQLIRESDDRLISNLRQVPDRDIGSYLSELGIRAKKKAEDWGLLDPERFVV